MRDYRLASGVPVFRPLLKYARLAVSGADAVIAEVADQFNYDSQQTFTRAFLRHFGMPPGIWRITDAAKKIR